MSDSQKVVKELTAPQTKAYVHLEYVYYTVQ